MIEDYFYWFEPNSDPPKIRHIAFQHKQDYPTRIQEDTILEQWNYSNSNNKWFHAEAGKNALIIIADYKVPKEIRMYHLLRS